MYEPFTKHARLTRTPRMAEALASSGESTTDLFVATERLRQELEANSRRQELVSSFLQKYQLTTEEVGAAKA